MATKKSDKTACAIWEVERKRVETVANLDAFWALMKNEFTNLQKLRFPLIVRVSKPVEDIKGAIFAETEPVQFCIGGLMEGAFAMDELEIKLGLIQICEALNFVHSTAQMVHLNLSPWSIVVCGGDWKLAGFGFAAHQSAPPEKPLFDAKPSTSAGSHSKQAPKSVGITSPSLDFSAPEVVFMNRVTSAADMFALGCLIYRLFWACTSEKDRIKPEVHHRIIASTDSVDVYRQQIEKLPTVSLAHVPAGLRPTLELLLSADPSKRPTAEEVLKTDYFNDTALKILQYLAHFNEHDDRDKAEFLKGLKLALSNLNSFSSKILRQKLLPPLLSELRNTILVPLLLPNIFAILELIEKVDSVTTPERNGVFATQVLPELKPLVQIKEPLQIAVLLIQRLEFMSKRLPDSGISSHLAPIIYSGMDHPNGAVVVLALKELLPVLPLLEHETIRTELTPRVLSLIHNPGTPQVTRVQALFAMSKLIPFAARAFIETSIIPAVLHTLTIDRSPTTITSVVGVCDVVSVKFGPDYTAHRILPQLIPLLVDPGLARKQFDTTLAILNGMINRISESKKKAFDEADARAQPVANLEGASDAEKLQAFSAQLPPISSTVSNLNASTASSNRQSPALSSLSTNKPGQVAAPSLQPAITPDKGAATFNAVLSAQETQKKAFIAQKERSTLLDFASFEGSNNTFNGLSPSVSATSLATSNTAIAASSPLQAPSSPFSLDSDLFSLDMTAFNTDSLFTASSASQPSGLDDHKEPIYPSLSPAPMIAESSPSTLFASSTTSAPTHKPSPVYPSTGSTGGAYSFAPPFASPLAPSSSSPMLATSASDGYDDDDFFNPRAQTKAAPSTSIAPTQAQPTFGNTPQFASEPSSGLAFPSIPAPTARPASHAHVDIFS